MSPILWLSIAAASLLGFASFQFGSTWFHSASQQLELVRNRRLRLSNLRQVAEIARLQSELKSNSTSSLGWRVMEVAEIVQESEDCRSYYLVDPYEQLLPDFRPGQYLMVRPALSGAYQTTRCYSLSSSPNSRYWRITVKRQQGVDRQAKQGGLSRWLHSTIDEGDCLLVGGPAGQFFLDEDSSEPLVLLAAGVGITPMASMLRWSLEKTPDRQVVLLYQVRDLNHWPLGPALHSWQEKFSNIQIHTFCSRVPQSQLQTVAHKMGGDFHEGKFGCRQILERMPDSHCHFYMCGPDPWMTELRDGLIEHGVAPGSVHWESFGGTGKQPSSLQTISAEEALEVRFDASDVVSDWCDPEQTLWELARESEVEIPSGCLNGVCGCCRVKLLQGKVEHEREIGIELAEDECLPCVSRPKTAVILDI